LSEGHLYIGLMSGTSLDGVDAVLADFSSSPPVVRASAHRPFSPALRAELLALQAPGHDEIQRAAMAGNALALAYASVVRTILQSSGTDERLVQAIGCHGQTVRHRPESGFTCQIGNPALLAEKTGIRVVSDFRSRDIAAGGQGAPLVPAFHAEVFSDRAEKRAVLNIGGIANLTGLDVDGGVTGFDSGPGNALLDLWSALHTGAPFDDSGSWASGGRVIAPLLAKLQQEPYFSQPPPKSTGRDLFNETWLRAKLEPGYDPQSVQATLLELTVRSICEALARFLPGTRRVIACGGGTRNQRLMARLGELLAAVPLEPSDRHGIDPQLVEALAFAWLARQAVLGLPGNVPAVTGAAGSRILGAVCPP
jgi:anhydro-N-acetylmuramic acid kinase